MTLVMEENSADIRPVSQRFCAAGERRFHFCDMKGMITSMNKDSAHQSRWEISEVVFGIPFLTSIVLQLVVPVPLGTGTLRIFLFPVGVVLITAGIGCIVLARREFAHFGQSMEPGQAISRVIQTGVFSISRNPLYLGIVIALSGTALVVNSLWVLALLIAAVILCHYILIAPEERYLENKFGGEYLAYTSSVRRWLGRK